jgi:hypothetical protein
MQWTDWVAIAGTVGTFGFGLVSLYQATTLSTLRGAIRAHTQIAYNNYWNIGADAGHITSIAMGAPEKIDPRDLMGRARAADAASISGRHEVINFGREWGHFVPFPEKAWEPKAVLLKKSKGSRFLFRFSNQRMDGEDKSS